MLKINIKFILRNIRKNPVLTGIKIIGLTIGIACSILVYLYVNNELSFDKFHEKSDRIYRIGVEGLIGNTEIHQTFTCAPLPVALYNEFPEIESVVRLAQSDFTITSGEKIFFENDQIMADSTFFEVFTFPLIKGNPKKALTEPNSIVLTEKCAEKYFGEEDPMNKTLIMGDDVQFKVTGIVSKVPDNSHFHFDFIMSLNSFGYSRSNSWWNNNFRTYIALHEEADYKQLEAKFPDFITKYFFEDVGYDEWMSQGNVWEYYLQPLTSIHLNSDLAGELEPNGNLSYVRLFIIIGIFILIIACVNYMNLTTARSSNRANEIGVKKVNGSHKKSLVFEFLTESSLISIAAMVIGLVLVDLLLPYYNLLLDRELKFDLISHPAFMVLLLVASVIIGFISGSYPAFFLSSMRPVKVLKGNTNIGMKNSGFRNVLVVMQFSISVALIVGTLFINKQLNFIKNERLGFNKDQVLVVRNSWLLNKENDVIKEQLLKSPYIKNASFSHTIPGQQHNNNGFTAEQVEAWFTLNVCVCDPDYMDVMGLELADGRFFSKEMEDDANTIIINEAAANLVGYKDGPIGKIFSDRYEVIGVMKDFHYESMHQKVRPMVFINSKNPNWMRPSYISIKAEGQTMAQTIKHVQDVWKDNTDGYPLDYTFLDVDYDKLYKNEEQTSSLFMVFSVLAILIACLGLIGLSTFVIEQRLKEISIRKVNGAKEYELISMLNWDFAKWVVISYIIACPLAYIFINNWIESFAYHVNMSWWIFGAAGIIALLIAVFTVSLQTWRAVNKNPVEALRYE